MSREWKAGDVALVTYSNGSEAVSILTDRGDLDSLWIAGGQRDVARNTDVTARPLVVIDPEDREQARALANALPMAAKMHVSVDDVQDALRSLVTPPPKPDEPTGLGAVVEDAAGLLWVRVNRQLKNEWRLVDASTATGFRRYADIAAVKVLSEGVTA